VRARASVFELNRRRHFEPTEEVKTMRRFFTLTLLTALLLTAGNSPSAQQRVANPVRQETKAEAPDGRAAADEDFARACQEASKLTGRLGTDRKFADRFVEAARAQDRAKTDALLKEAGVRGDIKVQVGGASGDDQANKITITFCLGPVCVTIIITRKSAA
jgi:hypothetical protein